MKEHQTAAWRDAMRLKINYKNMMQSALIHGRPGVHPVND